MSKEQYEFSFEHTEELPVEEIEKLKGTDVYPKHDWASPVEPTSPEEAKASHELFLLLTRKKERQNEALAKAIKWLRSYNNVNFENEDYNDIQIICDAAEKQLD